jgi:hypothetical protein
MIFFRQNLLKSIDIYATSTGINNQETKVTFRRNNKVSNLVPKNLDLVLTLVSFCYHFFFTIQWKLLNVINLGQKIYSFV